MNQLTLICMIGATFCFWLFIHQIFSAIFSVNVYRSKKKRLAQLNGIHQIQKTNEEQMKELLDTVTGPVISHYFKKKEPKNLDTINRDLQLIGWDRYMDAERKVALSLVCKIAGLVVGGFLFMIEPFIGVIWGAALMFTFDLAYTVTVQNKLEALLIEFPDFIETVESYLSADYDFERAVKETLPSTHHWQPILREFLVTCQYENLQTGLKQIHDMVNIFEVREFLSILQLGIEQGLDMRENIAHQSSRIEELQDIAFAKKIANREVMAVVVQGPLLITILVAFGLPTVDQFMNLGLS